ncbi:hypothetical protein DFH08DRAFT_804690 [Mycena albidolilacea]|uniref:Uncharacterized protein n=1 Tax=Mycena albidolilacea TaxID=1033008 RepID=A0AAD7A9T9_9AGAR|nr:hypothetical protein DFH08DRAFT_804690 [Mycena albidolilacea]
MPPLGATAWYMRRYSAQGCQWKRGGKTICPPVHRVDRVIHTRMPAPEPAPLALPGAGEVLKRDDWVGEGEEGGGVQRKEGRRNPPCGGAMRKSSFRPCSSVRSSTKGAVRRRHGKRRQDGGAVEVVVELGSDGRAGETHVIVGGMNGIHGSTSTHVIANPALLEICATLQQGGTDRRSATKGQRKQDEATLGRTPALDRFELRKSRRIHKQQVITVSKVESFCQEAESVRDRSGWHAK